MIRSKQLAKLVLAASIPAATLLVTLMGCRTTVVQPVEVRHVPADDHHDDHRDDHHDDDQRPPDRH